MSKGRNLTVVNITKGATVCKTKNGKKVTLLTPTGRNKRYKRELKSGFNSRTGEKLSPAAKAYRMGYRTALGETAAVHKNYMRKHS